YAYWSGKVRYAPYQVRPCGAVYHCPGPRTLSTDCPRNQEPSCEAASWASSSSLSSSSVEDPRPPPEAPSDDLSDPPAAPSDPEATVESAGAAPGASMRTVSGRCPLPGDAEAPPARSGETSRAVVTRRAPAVRAAAGRGDGRRSCVCGVMPTSDRAVHPDVANAPCLWIAVAVSPARCAQVLALLHSRSDAPPDVLRIPDSRPAPAPE